MQTKTYTQVDYLRPVPSVQAHAVLALMASLNMPAQYLARAPLPTEVIEVEDWTIKPWIQDDIPLPPEAWKAVMALNQAGIRPLGYMILHEKIKKPEVALLPATSKNHKPALPQVNWRGAWSKVREVGVAAMPALVSAAKATAKVAADVTVAAAKVVAVGTVLTLGLVGAALADPVLVACLAPDADDPDQRPIWVELARWWEEEK